jgi:hypothetical protein
MTITEAAMVIQEFQKGSLSDTIADLEIGLRASGLAECKSRLGSQKINSELLTAALLLKREAGQINVLIHSVGILVILPCILEEDEKIEYVSLGAGNTGRTFDLETNTRIAEFKFVNWRGGAEAIRQNSLFKDFYMLAECDTDKQRFLYLIGTRHPMRFLNSSRALESVMSRNIRLWNDFRERYGKQFSKVYEYYEYRKDLVRIVDVSKIVPVVSGLTVVEDIDLS